MKFVKMHGCGNDYIYIQQPFTGDRRAFALKYSDRHKGIGGDGVVFIEPSDIADCKMDMYNADGSQGKMCGNAIRCVGILTGAETVETLSGIKTLKYSSRGVTVDMGAAKFDDGHSVSIYLAKDDNGNSYGFHPVSMGNPHIVAIVDDVKTAPVHTLGPEIEKAIDTNVEFIKVIDRQNIDFRVWERGSGETQACGTGACAAAAIAHKLGLVDNSVTVHLLGGILEIEITAHTVFMTGEAVKVFEGEIDYDNDQ